MTKRAARYEEHAHVQRMSAADLLSFTRQGLDDLRVRRILEPGCGTGLYTRMLLDAFPDAAVEGIDLSGAMVRLARERTADPRVRFRTADAEGPLSGKYDLVTSNAAFQWFLSFDRTIQALRSLLPGGGLLTFSYFGPGTFAELDEALRGTREDGNGERAEAARFLSREEVGASLSAAFPRSEVVERRYHWEFQDLAGLLKSIRYTSSWGSGPRRGWSPGRLARVERAYRERFGGIRATYQVFLCRGAGRKGEAA